MTALVMAVQLTGVVDRIEGELAVVEWTDGGWSDLPLELLPETTGEGDTVALSLRTRPRGSVHITGPHADLVITHSGSWRLPAPLPLSTEQAWRLRSFTQSCSKRTRALRRGARHHDQSR